jgi:hypothetical protein
MQGIHLFILVIVALSLVHWDAWVLFGIFYIVFNISSLVFILVGAIKKEEKEVKTEVVVEEPVTTKKSKK